MKATGRGMGANRMKRKLVVLAVVGVATLAAACSSTPSGTAGKSGSTAKKFTIGILTDLTGLASTNNASVVQGVKAGIHWAETQGYDFTYDTADTASNPSGVLPAMQKLVEQDHVFAVVSDSSLTFLNSTYLTQQGEPVVGIAEDGPEWITAPNMFSVVGPIDFKRVATTEGLILKNLGGTNVGTLGYGISPSSAAAAEGTAASAEYEGLKVGYVNSNFSFGSTNVAPVVLAMQNAGVDAVSGSVESNTFYALVNGLRDAGVKLKVVLSPTGYGGDLLNSGPGAIHAAKDVYFISPFEPFEMHTAATKAFQSDLEAVGINGDPTLGEYVGYTSIVLLVQGLKAAGSNPTQSDLIKALSNIKDFTGNGLFGSHSINFGDRTATILGADDCYWITQFNGSKFDLVHGMDPICGTIIPGKTISVSG